MENKAFNLALTVLEFLRSRIGPVSNDSSALYGKVSTEADLASTETLLEHKGFSDEKPSITSEIYKGCVLSAKVMFLVSYAMLAYCVIIAKKPVSCVLGNEGKPNHHRRST